MNNFFGKYSPVLLLGLLVLAHTSAFAQIPSNEEFEVINIMDRVTKNAIKLGENPVIDNDTLEKPELNYSVLSKEIPLEYEVDHIPPAKLGSESVERLYHSYVKAGFGNYTTPLFELSINKLRSKKASMGLFLHHLSSSGNLANVGFPGFSDNEARFFASKYYDNYTLNGSLDYQRNVVHFYGYDANDSLLDATLNRDNTKQRFSFIGTNVELVQSKKNKPKWLNRVALDYYNYMDLFDSQENKVGFDLGLNKAIKKKYTFTFDASIDYYNHKFTALTFDNIIFSLQPMIGMEGKRGTLMIGTTLAFDATSNGSVTHMYPQAYGHYDIVDDILIFFGEVTGGVRKNSYRSLTLDNPFLNPNGNLENTSENATFAGGLRGAFSKRMTFSARVSQSFSADMPFFVNDTSIIAGNQFDVIYDDASLLNLRGELGYQVTEKISATARVDYYKYTMDKELMAWFKPEIVGSLGARYSMRDKIIVRADVYYIHEQFAKTYGVDSLGAATVVPITLKGLIDANLGVEYRYSRALSAFVNFNNLAAYHYYRWHQYPSQRFNFLAGLTFSF